MEKERVVQDYIQRGYAESEATIMGDAFEALKSLRTEKLRETFGDDNRYLTFEENGEFRIKVGFKPNTVLEQFQAYQEISNMPEQDKAKIMELITKGLYCPSKAIAKHRRSQQNAVDATHSLRKTQANTTIAILDQ